ncbi:Serine/arginine repetitive matrix protein 2 isoform 2 [Gossypium australe]|uniref:Serine/arginine repetitive matrix protein 2 isoform 2 n=1 Tax=Gossypium australe TaxID=47621 RepID=A0A5B6UM39_9ROSI|nr:Serine/arginine repetitive matrix protein 2 isoform 2 [Gossypium australe]
MATSSKFDLPSDSPDRPLYTSGQRGAHLAAQLDRSGSFRETLDNQIQSSLASMSRSTSLVAQGDVSNFFQCLRFDPKVVAADHKSSRQGDFKRHINAALGISADEGPTLLSKGKLLPSPIPEEIKRVKTGLRDCSVKARERMKTFNEALSVFNKFFPTIPSKKRSRTESFSSDRSNALLSSDRSVLGPSIGKMGIHNHSIAGGFEFEQPKSEERPKSAFPNKRTRTSLLDVRFLYLWSHLGAWCPIYMCAPFVLRYLLYRIFNICSNESRWILQNNSLVRQPGNADRDREMLRVSNSAAVQGEDRTLAGAVDGWEKAKMKKKRSGIKPDVSPSMVSTKPIEGYREPKQGIQQRPVSDARSRLNNDSHEFRSGISNGSAGVGKSEGISLPTGLGPRSSVPRTDLDSSSLRNDKRDRPVASDKERVNLRAVNKMSVRDEFNSASPTSNTKMNASIRGPRSGSGVAPKLSPVVHRTASNDWELSHCTNKPPTAGGVNNRKRTISTQSSSPPVAHWASQRPQKSSRSARRTNLVPVLSNNDETPLLDTVSDMPGNEIGSGYSRRLSSGSPQQVKLKGDALSSAALSESEESGAAEIKCKGKVTKFDEIDEKAGQNVQKVSNLILPSRKNKLINGEDIGDGVRRQGRTGRGITTTRSLMPMTVEKYGNVGTAKQLRSARLGLDKAESKAGRPPTRKLTDRKPYARQKHAAINAAADLLVGSEDGHEELVAAVNALTSSARAFPNTFWRQMEPFLGFISDADIAYLKQQGNYELNKLGSTPVPSITDGCSTPINGFELLEHERDVGICAVASVDVHSQQLLLDTRDNNVIPLCQRFLSALIPEEDIDSGNEDLPFDSYETGFEMDGELGCNGLTRINFQSTGHASFDGYRITEKPEHDDPEIDMLGNIGTNSNFSHSRNGSFPDQQMPGMVCSKLQYESMTTNEKLILEAQSIGIFLEPLVGLLLHPDIAQMGDVEILEDISKLEEKHKEQVSKKKGVLDKLLKAASETRTIQEKEFEQCALDKLVTMAYEKYMTCWGPNATKSSSNKMIKQASLAFVKRTLDRCHKFEDTSRSCFDEPMLRDMFLSGSSQLNGVQSVESPTDTEFGKPCTKISTRFLEARASGQNGDSYAVNSSDLLLPTNRSSDQTTVKDDSWSNRGKRRELLLEDVVGGTSSAQPGIGSSLSSSTKGKRSERDREGNGHGREVLSRNGTNKIGRPVSNAKGERKSKTKPKQKTTQLSASVNGLLGKMSEPKTSTSVSKSSEITANNNAKDKDEFALDVLDDLQLPGQDLGSWLNIDDDGLQDHDFMGLEIPMDDLSDLNMMV